MAEAKKTGAKKQEKVAVTQELRRIWWKVRNSWNVSFEAFTNTLSMLTTKQAELLYGVVKHSLFKESYVQMLREHPELRELVKSDDDRLCMHDVYEAISWRLGRQEKLPSDVEVKIRMKGSIGRGAPVFSY